MTQPDDTIVETAGANGVLSADQRRVYEESAASLRQALAMPLDDATRQQLQAKLAEYENALAASSGATASSVTGQTVYADTMGTGGSMPALLGQNSQPINNNSLNLTLEELMMIQNFADRMPDGTDEESYRLMVVDAQGNLSKKYYRTSEDGVIYRAGDKQRKPVRFNDTYLQLTEYDYMRYLASLKDYQRKNGRKINELSDDEKAEREAEAERNKPWLVRTADWIDKNIFGWCDSIPLVGTIVKMVGGAVTGLLRMVGYAFNGEWKKAGEAALDWLPKAAIATAVAWGASKLYKYFTKDSSSNSTTSSTTTNDDTTTETVVNKVTQVSTVSSVSNNNTRTADLMKRLSTSAKQTEQGVNAISKIQNTNG